METEHDAISSPGLATASDLTPTAPRRSFPLLPHEIIFGFFLLATFLRLAARLGPVHGYTLIFLGCLLGAGAVAIWARRDPSPMRWRVRLLYYPVAMGISFYSLELAIPALGVPKVDDLLLSWDRALFGETPSVGFQFWGPPWLNDLLMLGYLFFFYQLIVIPGWYCVRDLPRFRQCFVGLYTVFGLGYLGYTLLPAGGPHRWMSFEVPLNGLFVIPWTLSAVNSGSNCVDVFPSLHFAVSLYLLVFDWWHRRRRFWWSLAPCIVLWLSAVLLRFHYFVDLLGGLVVALCGLGVARWYERRGSEAA